MRLLESKRYRKTICYLITAALLFTPIVHAGSMYSTTDATVAASTDIPCHQQAELSGPGSPESSALGNADNSCEHGGLCEFICSVTLSPALNSIALTRPENPGIRIISIGIKPDLVSLSPPYKPPRG
jgi:hypothetical protein